MIIEFYFSGVPSIMHPPENMRFLLKGLFLKTGSSHFQNHPETGKKIEIEMGVIMFGKKSVFWFLIIPLIFPILFADIPKRALREGYDSIRLMDSYYYCKALSSEAFSGRLTGHEGYTKAAEWVAERFREWELTPLNSEEGFFQAFPSPYTVIDHAEMTLFLQSEESGLPEESSVREVNLEPGKDFLPLLFSDSGDYSAGLVFAGWGISAPELGYDDYAELDVKGEFVLAFRGTPDSENKNYQKYDVHRYRMNTAKEKGALGLIYIYPEVHAHPHGDRIEGFIPAMISEEVADMLLEDKELKATDLKAHLRTYKRPLSFPLETTIRINVTAKHFPDGIGYNVVGYVEGSHRRLKKECLVIGAHLDHCGRHMGFHFSGADDNASGSGVVMEIAQAFSGLEKKPKRSIVFVLFGGEEMGLIGSNYFLDHLPPQFEKVDGMFNFDMVGEGDGTGCAHSQEPPDLKKILESADAHVHTLEKTKVIKEVGVRSSDFAPFFLKNIPCLSFWSDGPHLHYHQTGDRIYRINPDMLVDVARLGYLTAFAWADR